MSNHLSSAETDLDWLKHNQSYKTFKHLKLHMVAKKAEALTLRLNWTGMFSSFQQANFFVQNTQQVIEHILNNF